MNLEKKGINNCANLINYINQEKEKIFNYLNIKRK